MRNCIKGRSIRRVGNHWFKGCWRLCRWLASSQPPSAEVCQSLIHSRYFVFSLKTLNCSTGSKTVTFTSLENKAKFSRMWMLLSFKCYIVKDSLSEKVSLTNDFPFLGGNWIAQVREEP